MPRDVLGNEISSRVPASAAAIDDFVLGFLGYDLRIVNVLDAASSDPADALLNAYAGLLWMLSETGDIPAQARHFLAAAEAAPDALPRERDTVRVLRLWIEDDLAASRATIARILAAHPRDLVMLKLHQYHDFNVGDFPSMLRVALGSREAASDVAYLHGMLAFAYEQCHLLAEAERSARAALAIEPREPWAQHALAHVMLTEGRIDEGVRFLESVRGTWTGLTSFMDTHLWWHLALFYMSQGRTADALDAYDRHCWAREKDFSQDQIGAVSLLARLECAGAELGDRWTELGRHLVNRSGDIAQPFLSLQYLYGLARARRPEADTLLARIREAASDGPAASRAVWRDVGIDIAEGLVAHANGAWEASWRAIEPKLSRLAEIGGSHAQRDLFELLVLDALHRSGRLARAQQALELRRQANPADVPTNRLLAEIYDGLGLPELARAADARAESRGM